MRKSFLCLILLLILAPFSGCGYSTSSLLPSNIKTIYVEHFENDIDFTSEQKRNVYLPLLEVEIRDAITDRFLFDGNLKVAKKDMADLVMNGRLIGYERDALRFTDNDDVEEYRIHVIVALEVWDSQTDELFWEEPSFIGETTYFISGPNVKNERDAVDDAVIDLARRVVERTIENW